MNLNRITFDEDVRDSSGDDLVSRLLALQLDKDIIAAYLIEQKEYDPELFNAFSSNFTGKKNIDMATLAREARGALDTMVQTEGYAGVLYAYFLMQDRERKILSPYEVTSYLFEKFGITAMEVPEENVISYRKGDREIKVPMKLDFPSFPKDFRQTQDGAIMNEMVDGANIAFLPMMPDVDTIVGIIMSVMRFFPRPQKFAEKHIYLMPKDASHFQKTLPPTSPMFLNGQWHPKLITLLYDFTNTAEIKAELFLANRKDITARLYSGICLHFKMHNGRPGKQMKINGVPTQLTYNQTIIKAFKMYLVTRDHILTVEEKQKIEKGAMPEPNLMQKLVIRQVSQHINAKNYSSVQSYLEASRANRGTDQKDISVLTRNCHIGSFLPDQVSTAHKFLGVVSTIKKLNPKYITYFGCSPGNALPMLYNQFAHYLQGQVINKAYEEYCVHEYEHTKAPRPLINLIAPYFKRKQFEYQPAIYFYDIAACGRKDYKWDYGDLFTIPVYDQTCVVSDCWLSGNAQEVNMFREKLFRLISSLTKGIDMVEKKPIHGCSFFIKVLIQIDVLKKENVSQNLPPSGWEYLFRQKPGKFYLTKFGRPHNQEFLVSSHSLGPLSREVTDIITFMAAINHFAQVILFYNVVRNAHYLVSPRSKVRLRDPVFLTHDDFPRFIEASVLYQTTLDQSYMEAYFTQQNYYDVEEQDLDDVLNSTEGEQYEDVGKTPHIEHQDRSVQQPDPILPPPHQAEVVQQTQVGSQVPPQGSPAPQVSPPNPALKGAPGKFSTFKPGGAKGANNRVKVGRTNIPTEVVKFEEDEEDYDFGIG